MKTPKRHINRSYDYNKTHETVASAQSHEIIFNPLSDDQIKISELPEASGLDGGDLLPVVDISGQALVTKKITLSNFIESTFNTSILPSGDNIKFSFNNDILYVHTSPIGYFTDLFINKNNTINKIHIMYGQTSGNPAGPIELTLDSSNHITIPSGTILSGTANIIGTKDNGLTIARYYRQFTIKNVNGTTSLVGSDVLIGSDEVNGTSISITANNMSDYLSIKVSGVNNEIWKWAATVNAVNITYNI